MVRAFLHEAWVYHCKRRLLLMVFLVGGFLATNLAIVWMLLSIIFQPYGRRPLTIALAFDQLANAALGGSEDETISSRAAREQEKGARWACILCKLLDKLDKNHCENSKGV